MAQIDIIASRLVRLGLMEASGCRDVEFAPVVYQKGADGVVWRYPNAGSLLNAAEPGFSALAMPAIAVGQTFEISLARAQETAGSALGNAV